VCVYNRRPAGRGPLALRVPRAPLLRRAAALASLVAFTYGIAYAPTSVAATTSGVVPSSDEPPATAPPPRRSERILDRFRTTLTADLGKGNRGVAERVQVTQTRTGAPLEIMWAIDATPGRSLSLDVAANETRAILQAVKENRLSYRRVVLKGSFALPGLGGSLETMVVRAVYVRSTLRALDFDTFDPGAGRTILDLADELRLALILGGYGIPSEPATATRTSDHLV
jgi:hypothetical protein